MTHILVPYIPWLTDICCVSILFSSLWTYEIDKYIACYSYENFGCFIFVLNHHEYCDGAKVIFIICELTSRCLMCNSYHSVQLFCLGVVRNPVKFLFLIQFIRTSSNKSSSLIKRIAICLAAFIRRNYWIKINQHASSNL